MKKFIIFKITFVPPTETKGARVRIRNEQTNKREFVPFDYAVTGIENMAKIYLEKQGYTILGYGYNFSEKGHYICVV